MPAPFDSDILIAAATEQQHLTTGVDIGRDHRPGNTSAGLSYAEESGLRQVLRCISYDVQVRPCGMFSLAVVSIAETINGQKDLPRESQPGTQWPSMTSLLQPLATDQAEAVAC